MADVVGPLGRAITVQKMGVGLGTANALLILSRCAVVEGGKLDEKAQLGWAVRTGLGHEPTLAGAVARRRRLAGRSLAAARTRGGEAITVKFVRLTPESALLVGAGETGTRNVGMALHGTYGWPVLRGSALKGVAHAYARDVKDLSLAERVKIFGGPRPGSQDAEQGGVVFLDTISKSGPIQISVHVLTPHAGPYYRDESHRTPPAEYWNPVPVEFLAVERATLVAGLLGSAAAVDRAEELLVEGLAVLGAGAKTAAGYGYLMVDEGR